MYVFVIIDEYSKFTWTIFFRTKDETYDVLMFFAKQIQMQLNQKIEGYRSDHGTESKNS